MGKHCGGTHDTPFIDVCKDGRQSCPDNGEGGGYERHGRHNDLAIRRPTVPLAQGLKRQRQSVKSITDSDAVGNADGSSKVCFKIRHAVSAEIPPAFDDVGDGVAQCGFETTVDFS